MEDKKLIFSGIQPTGTFTLGNYIGAVRNWGTLQEKYNCIYCVVDMHAITVKQDPIKLRQNTLNSYALLMACGIDVEKSILFIQSHVKTHAELSWILGCNTQFGELSRMTQFKDKAAKHADNINAGLFTYPVLMAADILLYQADFVPVGKDQKQHLEITRDIAERFNSIYGEVFTVPEPYFGKTGANIMSLQDPTRKMSKSDENVNGSIFLMDDMDTIVRKCKRAVTDSGNEIRYGEDKPGISNLLEIYGVCTGKSIEEAEKEFSGVGYGDFKVAVAEAVISMLKPLQEEYARLLKEKDYIDGIIKANDEKAAYFANKTLRKVKKKLGLTEKPR